MPSNEYIYYRYRRIRRNVVMALFAVLVLALFFVMICGSEKTGIDSGRRVNNDPESKGLQGYGTGNGTGGNMENGKNETEMEIRRKNSPTARTPVSSVNHPAIEKVKKVEPEKRLPLKPPTLEIIGSDGNVLMKKE